ncbi:LLM class flavin-dependent oxidoreductase [Pseudorhodoferax sp.]|uniref:LLM class flavin-dependent oxidoreductase n=1 Tax=Pseudorhodoferax sp. TaxID=1993553 RepID=UPI0039E59B98
MRFGIATYGFRPDHIVPLARHAESLGFHGIWLGEHILEPKEFESEHPHDEGKAVVPVHTRARTMYDMWTMVGGILGATSRLTVTTGIYLLPLRHPVATARAAITAQQIGGGRFNLGMGAGWWKEESENLGMPFEGRMKRYNESLRVLPRLFAGEWVANEGPAFPFQTLRVTEEPVHIPMIFGGTAPKALDRAARAGAGWYGPMVKPEESIALMNQIRERREAMGLTTPYSYQARVWGEPTPELMQPYLDAGFDTLVLPCETFQGRLAFDMTLDQKYRRLEQIARDMKLQA